MLAAISNAFADVSIWQLLLVAGVALFASVLGGVAGYGTGALLGRGIKKVRAVHWLEELGIAQAMWVFEVENFGPFLVDGDLKGNSLFEIENRKVNEKLADAYKGLKEPALRRYGETTSRKDEVI